MTIEPKTTYRSDNDSGNLEVRKSFAVKRENLKVWTKEDDNGTEVTHIEVPVSSPSEDRDGDEFSEEGLDHQADQFRSGTVGMWLDHGLSPETSFADYRVLEQIGGWKDAEIREGELFATAALRPSSDEAKELETMLDEGVAPVGFSVGFIVTDSTEKENGGVQFDKVDLLECSAVGIPSNPDAMVSDSAMAAAKAVSDAGGYDGEAEELARAITTEMRSVTETTTNETRTTTMSGGESKQSEEEYEAAIAALESYLETEDASGEDTVTDAVQWATENESANADALAAVAESAVDALDADGMDALTVSEVVSYASENKEADEDEDGEEEESSDGEGSDEDDDDDDDDDDKEPGKSEGDSPELRTAVRDALNETLPKALTNEEEMRSLVSEEVRSALSEEEFSVDVTEGFKETLVEELRSELFKEEKSETGKKPAPAGTIATFEPEESNSGDGEEEQKNNGGSENVGKPSPAIGN